jgi:hypothetical protein
MRSFVLMSCVSVFLMLSQAALANDHPNLDAQAIVAQQNSIRAEVRAGAGRYKGLEADKRDDLFARQDRVMRLLTGKTNTTELSEADQIAVFNDLEGISAIINKAEDDRMICQRSKPVGSNRPKTVCLTVQQRREANEAAANQLNYRDQQCFKSSTGECL